MQEQAHPQFRYRLTQTQHSTRTCGILHQLITSTKNTSITTDHFAAAYFAADHFAADHFCTRAMAN